MDDVRLIDANALLKKLQEQQKYSSAADSRGRAKAILEVIHAPTIPAQPVKRGNWETKGGVHCTRCGWRPSGKICDLFTNYCAGCGADMRGDKK